MNPISHTMTAGDPRMMIDRPISEHRLLGLFSAQANAARRVLQAAGETAGLRQGLTPRRVLRREVAST